MSMVRHSFFGVVHRTDAEIDVAGLRGAVEHLVACEPGGRMPPILRRAHMTAVCERWQAARDGPGNPDAGAMLLLSGYPLKPAAMTRAAEDWLVPVATPEGLSRVWSEVDGPFLAGLLDPASRSLCLFRDKFGLRPLYYWRRPDTLWFADDIRLLCQLAGQPQVRMAALLEWLYYGVPLEPATFFHEFRSLPAGHMLVYNWSDGTLRQQRYFEARSLVDGEEAGALSRVPTVQLEGRVAHALEAAIRRGLGGQKAVSVLVSGGVDSSLVASIASRHASVTPVTVDVCGPGGESELPYTRAVTRHLRLDLRVCSFGPEAFRRSIGPTVHALGTPIIVENAVALYHAARSGALPAGQLILDGEGADALFCGSTGLFKYSMAIRTLAGMFRLSTFRVRSLLGRLRHRLSQAGMDSRTTLDLGGLDVLLGARRMEQQQLTLELMEAFAHLPDQADREIAALSLREFYDYLVPLMLRIDRMAAAADTAAVLPFLDTDLFRLGVNLPMDMKLRWSWRRRNVVSKWLLKQLACRHIPASIVYRPKGGFHIPGGAWIGPFPRPWLADCWLCEQFGIRRETLVSWLGRNPVCRDRMFLITMEIWGRLFARGIPIQQVQQEMLADDGAGPASAARADAATG